MVLDLALAAPGGFFLVTGAAGTAGILGGALALGIRHGIDWDHIAAITDITSTTAANEPATELARADSERVHASEPHPLVMSTLAATVGAGSPTLSHGWAAEPSASSPESRVISFVRHSWK